MGGYYNYTLNGVKDLAHKNSKDKGWWDDVEPGDDSVIPEKLMLIVTEVSEAMEDYRNGNMEQQMELQHDGNGKPVGFPSELADVIIRVADLCGHLNIDITKAIEDKMEYNKTRSYRHGGKAC